MDKNLSEITKDLKGDPGVAPEDIQKTEELFGVHFPEQYRDWLTKINGAEGEIGKHSYLMLWPLEEIFTLNEAYEVKEFAPGLILFGSDGGDTAYAFDFRKDTIPVIEVPFIGMSTDSINQVAATFDEFLGYLFEK